MRDHHEIVDWLGNFLLVLLGLAIASFWFTYLDKNVARKKRLIPILIVGIGVILASFMLLTTRELTLTDALFILSIIALITLVNLRMIRVCSSCGRTIQSGIWFARADYCPRCGARLE